MTTTHNNKRKKILIGLGVLGGSVAGFLGWNFLKNRKKAKEENEELVIETQSAKPASSTNEKFPLKNGSKGEKVKQLQNALMKKYGAGILPKYGADGIFGKETAAGLVRAKLPATINETMFNTIVGANFLSGIFSVGAKIISMTDCEIFKVRDNSKIKMPKNTVLGNEEFAQKGWIYFSPLNSTELFRVKQEKIKSF